MSLKLDTNQRNILSITIINIYPFMQVKKPQEFNQTEFFNVSVSRTANTCYRQKCKTRKLFFFNVSVSKTANTCYRQKCKTRKLFQRMKNRD